MEQMFEEKVGKLVFNVILLPLVWCRQEAAVSGGNVSCVKVHTTVDFNAKKHYQPNCQEIGSAASLEDLEVHK